MSIFFLSVPTETPPKDGEEAASSSDSASDPASSLFNRWGRDLGPESRRVALKKFRYFGYNGYLSDRISLTRPIPDLRPDGSVHYLFHSFILAAIQTEKRLNLSFPFLQMQKHVLFVRPSSA